MICFPNCKINLGLKVKGKRPDGYHNIETVFYPVNLTDVLEIIPAQDGIFDFNITGIEIPGDITENLCVKAYNLLAKEYKIPSVKIHLHKNIPIGAGLGGGSSDAAFTLILLDKIFSLNLTKNKLIEMSSQLGSDCAFFIENKPCFAYEKGNIMETINLDLKKYKFIIIKPNINISTTEAYKNIFFDDNTESLKIQINKPVETWRDNIFNDFEKYIFKSYPEIKKIKEFFYQKGAIYASMSGSGSAVYGIFEDDVNIENPFQEYFFKEIKDLKKIYQKIY
ncbi:MAG: 4-(cytidine 5'-diphospho)-2-C-methyl-D-erythritol kinase [Bacteroidales bacterium]|nr:4-(cytidine 5'-diphospho)-2-C-methyl-D-erythritol kinase [Bacteroidales bacterium]